MKLRDFIHSSLVVGGAALAPTQETPSAPPLPRRDRSSRLPAQRASEVARTWLRDTAKQADMVMSVCTGAFQLARVGLLDGLAATTHHESWDEFERQFPKVRLETRHGTLYGAPERTMALSDVTDVRATVRCPATDTASAL